jgi:hypothetical protein
MATTKRASSKVLGYARFGAYMHRNNGGKMNISAYTAVNKPLAIDAADETVRIAERTYKIIEEERPELDGSKFYSKDVWNEQSGDGDTYSNTSSSPAGNNGYGNEESKEPADGLSPLKVLKNFVDNIAADNRTQWWVIVVVAIIAATAIAVAIVK